MYTPTTTLTLVIDDSLIDILMNIRYCAIYSTITGSDRKTQENDCQLCMGQCYNDNAADVTSFTGLELTHTA